MLRRTALTAQANAFLLSAWGVCYLNMHLASWYLGQSLYIPHYLLRCVLSLCARPHCISIVPRSVSAVVAPLVHGERRVLTDASLARSWTKLWNNVPKRAAVVLVSGLVMMYAGIKYDYLGAAALVPALARVWS